MDEPLVVPLTACTDRALVGGKAWGLAQLIHAGFTVPSGCCLTTAAYRIAVAAVGLTNQAIDSETFRQRLTEAGLPQSIRQALEQALPNNSTHGQQSYAVRSSATIEDGMAASLAGQFVTRLHVRYEDIPAAVIDCWASLHKINVSDGERARAGPSEMPLPAMAVVIQPMVSAQAAGVMFSRHPITGRVDQVLINAVHGIGAALVAGEAEPNEYVVPVSIPEPDQQPAFVGAISTSRAQTQASAQHAVLTDEQVRALALLGRRIEAALGYPVDVEWAIDGDGVCWLLQARPIAASPRLPLDDAIEWSRANFKETLPELPSPMALSFLVQYMETNLIAHYRALGCAVPDGWSSVRIVHGRPFINVTLFQHLVAQLRSDPALVTEQMGGQGTVPKDLPPRLSLWRFARAGLLAWSHMQRALNEASQWFEDMKAMADRPIPTPSGAVTVAAFVREIRELDRQVTARDHTFGIAAGVGQGLDALSTMLARWFPDDWRPLFNAALQGQGTVISAQQIGWLLDLAVQARQDPTALAFFQSPTWEPRDYRRALAGTAFLAQWDRFLVVYGQRAIGESDVAVPRHVERPESLLGAIRGYVQSDRGSTSRELADRQAQGRAAALARIRHRMRWWPGAWMAFHWQYQRLCRFLALREANRHHLMYYLAAVRRRLRAIGDVLAKAQRLVHPDDIFQLTVHDVATLEADATRDWRPLVAERQAEAQRHTNLPVPDFLSARAEPSANEATARIEESAPGRDRVWRGLPISPGLVEGPVCVVRSAADLSKLQQGAILVVAVIDPGLAPYFGLVVGLVADMGGTLSHGAIILRESGIPAVANLRTATQDFHDGERIRVDGSRGLIQRLSPTDAAVPAGDATD